MQPSSESPSVAQTQLSGAGGPGGCTPTAAPAESRARVPPDEQLEQGPAARADSLTGRSVDVASLGPDFWTEAGRRPCCPTPAPQASRPGLRKPVGRGRRVWVPSAPARSGGPTSRAGDSARSVRLQKHSKGTVSRPVSPSRKWPPVVCPRMGSLAGRGSNGLPGAARGRVATRVGEAARGRVATLVGEAARGRRGPAPAEPLDVDRSPRGEGARVSLQLPAAVLLPWGESAWGHPPLPRGRLAAPQSPSGAPPLQQPSPQPLPQSRCARVVAARPRLPGQRQRGVRPVRPRGVAASRVCPAGGERGWRCCTCHGRTF